MVQTCFRGNDFATIKNFQTNIFGLYLIPRKGFYHPRNCGPKMKDENFWLKPVFEEMILQP